MNKLREIQNQQQETEDVIEQVTKAKEDTVEEIEKYVENIKKTLQTQLDSRLVKLIQNKVKNGEEIN